MRISDWSSDVCSSDLRGAGELDRGHVGAVDVTGQEDDVLHAILDDGVEHGAPRGGEGGPGIALRLPADLLVRLTLAPLARGDRVRREDAGGDHELRHVAAFCLLCHQPAQQAVELARLLVARSEEHTSDLQSLIRTSYAVFCLKKK